MGTEFLESKMSFADKFNRYVIGCSLILLAMTTQSFPVWIALLGAYINLTALASWDPLYKVIELARTKLRASYRPSTLVTR